MDLETVLLILAAVGYIVLSIALILAIFSIRNNVKIQTELLRQQSIMLNSIQVSSFLLLKKSVSKVQVRSKLNTDDLNVELKVVDLADWLKSRNIENVYTVENVI